MANSFKGTVMAFPNRGIHFAFDEGMKFRVQLTKRLLNEWKSQSGWDDAMNRYIQVELEKLADTLERTTYNPHTKTQEELEAEAADTSRSLADDYDGLSLTHDNVLDSVQLEIPLEYDLSGSDVDIPQLDQINCPNDVARNFVRGLDLYLGSLTRLDSRHQSNMITKYDSVKSRQRLNELWMV